MSVSRKLLAWYDRHKHDRAMPWRDVHDAYSIWLSEIMLQQTTVGAVKGYYAKFLKKWPTVQDLAHADLEEVRAAWAGLGYYSRATNLHRCAVVVNCEHNRNFPESEEALLKLPGIGPYTAAAIAAIAFGKVANVVDGNVERVMARLHATNDNLRALAATYVPEERPGDYAQGLMDLGAIICTPKKPECLLCPIRDDCKAFALGVQNAFPARKVKKQPLRYAHAYLMTNAAGAVYLRKRPERGILAGLWEVPLTPFAIDPADNSWAAAGLSPETPVFQPINGLVRHVLTHMDLRVSLFKAAFSPEGGKWVTVVPEVPAELPGLTRKILLHYRESLGKD